MGVCAPVVAGFPTVLTSPVSFLVRPARWMQLPASHPNVFTSAPNFAFDLGGAEDLRRRHGRARSRGRASHPKRCERVHPVTVKRFTERFARFNLRHNVIQPSYGLAEATLYVATRTPSEQPEGRQLRHRAACPPGTRSSAKARVAHRWSAMARRYRRSPRWCGSSTRRPPTSAREGTTGEIWVHGDNVSAGYWRKPEETEHTFGAAIVEPSEGTPEAPWLRTGDRGFIFDDELFVVGRIKDLLIIYGRNHAPDDIEAKVTEDHQGPGRGDRRRGSRCRAGRRHR